MNPATKLQRAKIALLLDEPFFGTLLLGLKTYQDSTGTIPTMATDGERLVWSGQFVEELSEAEIKTVLCHEVLHCAYLHPIRRGDRDAKKWNQATDFAINGILEDYNQECQGKGQTIPFVWPQKYPPLKDPRFKGMSAEEIYASMPESQSGENGENGENGSNGGKKSSGKAPPRDQNGMGEVQDAPGDQAQKDEQEANWKVSMVQAATAAKMQGKLPANMARLIEDLLNPKERWQDHLRRFVQAHCKDDYSWTRPNTRYAGTGFILPSLYSQRLGTIAVAIDTSGSIDQAMINEFMGEVEGIAHECRPEKIILIDCDAQVHSVREFEPYEPLPRDFQGGGGTSHEPIWKELENKPPLCCVCFTDLYTTFGNDPGYPVLWATNNKGMKVPFGEVIEL